MAARVEIDVVADTTRATGALTDLKAGFDLVAKGAEIAKQAFDATVGATIEYANQVRELGQVNGQTAESNSRLIQLVDDYKVSISDLNATQRELTKDGKTMSVEFLAGVADQYANAATQADKNKVAQENLGRSYRSYIELLQQGGDAIREQGAAVSDSLVLNQKQLEDARKVEMAFDNLGDAVTGFAMVLGKVALPAVESITSALSELASATTQNLDDVTKFADLQQRAGTILKENGLAIDKYTARATGMKVATEEQILAAQRQAMAEIEAANAIETVTTATAEYIPTAEEQAATAKQISEYYNGLIGSITNVQSATDTYKQSTADLQAQYAALNPEIEQAKLWYGENSTQVAELTDKQQALSDKMTEVQAVYSEKLNQMVLDQIKLNLAVDGTFDEADFQKYLDVAQSMGMMDAASVELAKAQESLAKMFTDGRISAEQLKAALDALSKGTYPVNVIMNIAERGYAGTGAGASYATGDLKYQQQTPHANGGSWMVGPSWGTEGYPMGGGHTASPGETITVTPAGQSGGGASFDKNEMADAIVMALQRAGAF